MSVVEIQQWSYFQNNPVVLKPRSMVASVETSTNTTKNRFNFLVPTLRVGILILFLILGIGVEHEISSLNLIGVVNCGQKYSKSLSLFLLRLTRRNTHDPQVFSSLLIL